jgi:hypothetical protein
MSLLERVVNALDKHKIPYAIVGGVAVALHGAPRGTIDIDIVTSHKLHFFTSLEKCFKDLGFIPRLPVTANEIFNFKDEYISRRNLVAWSFFNPKNPVEVIHVILTHDLSDLKTVSKKMGISTIKVLAIEDLIRMKKKSGRPQDLEDIKVLKELLK